MDDGLAGSHGRRGCEAHDATGFEDEPDPEGEALRRANALVDFGRLPDAIAELRRGVGGSPDSAPLWSRLAWLLYRHDEHGESRFAAERTLALDPHDASALLTMALLEVQAEAPERAHDFADRALALIPDAPAAHLVKAMAFAAETAGAARHRQIIRDAAYYAVSLAPEDVDTLFLAASVLGPVAGKQEVAALVDRALALDPEHEDLQLLATRLHAKNDVQIVRGWSRVLAKNPGKVEPAFAIELFVWERTRLVAAFALWLIPAIALGSATVVAPLIVLAAAVRNLWDLLIGTRRSAPKGLLGRVWGEPRWARAGVICVFVGAAWPLFVAPIVLSGQAWPFALVLLVLGAGESIVVYAGQRNERKHLDRMGRTAALDLVGDFARRARLGWVRISLGTVALLVAGGVLAGAGEIPQAAGIAVAVVALAAALAVPPALAMARYRRTLREVAARSEEGRTA